MQITEQNEYEGECVVVWTRANEQLNAFVFCCCLFGSYSRWWEVMIAWRIHKKLKRLRVKYERHIEWHKQYPEQQKTWGQTKTWERKIPINRKRNVAQTEMDAFWIGWWATETQRLGCAFALYFRSQRFRVAWTECINTTKSDENKEKQTNFRMDAMVVRGIVNAMVRDATTWLLKF